MKKLIFTFLLFFVLTLKSQVCTTLVVYDNIETYTWSSGWSVGSKGGYYTNASVSSTTSAALIGNGNGSSPIEDGYYILPNVTGLISTNTHYLEFRLGSYKFGGPSAATAGTDVGDYVDVQYSTNGGTSYVSELRVTGNAGALWNYSSTAVASKTASGALTTFTPAGGGDRTLLGDGYATVRLTLTAGSTQAAFRLYCRANSDGEEWWIDDIQLNTIGPCVALPIELISFEGLYNNSNEDNYNYLTWVTASEIDNEYFSLERSVDALNWNLISKINGAGTKSTASHYEYKDYNFDKERHNYYRLKETDYNGTSKYSEIIFVINPETKKKILIKTISLDGKEVGESYKGIVVELYSDGSVKRLIKE